MSSLPEHDAAKWALQYKALVGQRNPIADTLTPLRERIYKAVSCARGVGCNPEEVLHGALAELESKAFECGRNSMRSEAMAEANAKLHEAARRLEEFSTELRKGIGR